MKPGEVIGNYEILEQVGSGAVGEVFRARQISMSRIVALKILSERFAEDGSFVDRFVREARSAGKCNHPNLIQVYDVGHSGGVYYFSMEFVGGPTLREVLEEKGPFPETEAVAHMIKIAGALGQAHSRGIVHRDVKPANIILTEQGEPKLADLGLAKPLDAGAEETNTERPLGTPYYMCPEQARGDRLDGRADLYALGATLFHLHAGETLFSASAPAAVMAKHLTDPPRPLREVRRDCSRGLEAVVMKLLAKDPGYRYQDAEALIWDLNAVADGRRPRHAKLLFDTGRQRPVSTRRSAAIRKASPARGARAGPWVAAGVIPAAAVAALILLFSRGGEDVGPAPPEPEKESSDSPEKPAAPKPAPKEDRSGRLAEEFRRAQSFAAKHPEDYEGAIRAFGAVQAAGRGGPFEKKAKARTAELRSAWKRAARAALREVLASDSSVTRPGGSGDYDAALGRLKAFATGAGTRKLASQVRREIREETRRIRRAGMAKIGEIVSAAEAQLEAGSPKVARKVLAAMSGVRYAEGRAAVAERVARLAGRIDAFGKEKPARRGGPAPQVPGESEESARRRLADILSEFEAHVKAGLYGEAAGLVEGASSKVTGDLGGTLRAASRVARAMEARQAAIRRRLGAMAARGGEVALETAKGVRRGKITEITADGIELAAKIVSGRQVMGQTKLSVRWSELSPKQEDRLARGWKPEGDVRPSDGHMARAVLAICREDTARAAQALHAAAGHPLAGYFRERLEELRVGPAEAAARRAWRRIEEKAGAKSLPAARVKALLGDIAAFEKKHGGTGFAASVADRAAAAKARAQGAMATVTGLVGYWKFDEGMGETAADSSGGGHHGTINGATWVRGRIGNALRFDGVGDYVQVGPVGIGGAAARTISGWVKASSTTHPAWTGVFGFTPNSARGGTYFDVEVGNANRYVLHLYGRQDVFCRVDTEWHHFAATYDGSEIVGYLDASPVISYTRTLRTIDEVAVGWRQQQNHYFNGLVDDVRIYSRALREEDIRSLSGAGPVR